jgi:hypothetical protein
MCSHLAHLRTVGGAKVLFRNVQDQDNSVSALLSCEIDVLNVTDTCDEFSPEKQFIFTVSTILYSVCNEEVQYPHCGNDTEVIFMHVI